MPVDITHAVVLAAGRGSRLRPLTDDVPKPMLPIDGTAVILTVLRQLERADIQTATVIVGYQGDVLRAFLDEQYAGTVSLSFAEQAEQRGSGHALQCALAEGMPKGSAVVMASDTVWQDADVLALLDAARSDDDAVVTMGLQRWPVAKLPHFCQTIVGPGGKVEVVVSPMNSSDGIADAAETALCGSPIYAFAPAIWDEIERITPSAHGLVELATALQRAIDCGQLVRGLEVAHSRDITRPDDLLRHNFPYLKNYVGNAAASGTPAA